MSRHNELGNSWPPRGWDSLGFIKELNGQAIAKDPMKATITGLAYKIEPVPIYLKNNTKSYVYNLSINGWTYSIQNESHEYSVLSFNIHERLNESLSKDNFIFDIKTKSRPLLLNNRSAKRAYVAALFIMKQIVSGQVPDYNRILRLYKIHPSQRSLYEIDNTHEKPIDRELIPYCIDRDYVGNA